MVYDVLRLSVSTILKPDYTASWETGLQGIADGKYTKQIYLDKIYAYIAKNTENMKAENHTEEIIKKHRSIKKGIPGHRESAAGGCIRCRQRYSRHLPGMRKAIKAKRKKYLL